MPRPSTVNDLPVEARRTKVGQIEFNTLATRPRLTVAIGEFLEKLEADHGVEIRTSYGGTELYVNASGQELESALAAAQSTWDYNHERYQAFVNGDPDEKGYLGNAARAFSKANPEFLDADETRTGLLKAKLAGESLKAALDEIEGDAAEVDEHFNTTPKA
jgi:hypothetical protein